MTAGLLVQSTTQITLMGIRDLTRIQDDLLVTKKSVMSFTVPDWKNNDI